MTLTRIERAAFIEAADAMRATTGSDVMTGDDALNYMIQQAAGGD